MAINTKLVCQKLVEFVLGWCMAFRQIAYFATISD